MPALFDRVASVEIGPPGGTGFEVTYNRIVFDVEKTDDASANRGRVEIVNLTKATRDRIKKLTDAMIIRAGYAEASGREVLFRGQIAHVEHRFQSPDWITRLETGDGLKALREARSSLSFSAGADAMEIVKKLTDDFGIPLRDKIDVPRIRWSQGFSYAGPTRDGLRKVLDRLGYDYSVQNETLQIIPKGGATGREAVLISSATGLISSPVPINDQDTDLDESKVKKLPGYAFRCLLQPRIEPGCAVRLESRDVQGYFRVNTVKHSGDTHGEDWVTEVEVSELK